MLVLMRAPPVWARAAVPEKAGRKVVVSLAAMRVVPLKLKVAAAVLGKEFEAYK